MQLCITIPDNMLAEAKQFIATMPQEAAGSPPLDPATATIPQLKDRGQSLLLRGFRAYWRTWRLQQPDTTLDTITTG